MTEEEKKLLWNPVRDKFFRHIVCKTRYDQDVERGTSLAEFLGTNEYEKWIKYSHFTPMNADLKATLQALAGPHGETIYKAMCVRKGIAP